MPSLSRPGWRQDGHRAMSLRQRFERHESLVAALAYALVLAATYSNVVFLGDSLVYSNNFNLSDHRITPRTHGPNARPATTWSDHNLNRFPNIQDPSATWAQWEPGGVFFLRSIRHRDPPFWDPYTGGGVPAMANLTQAFFFPPYRAAGCARQWRAAQERLFPGTAPGCRLVYLGAPATNWPSWSSSFLGGLAFMLSGGLTQTLGSFIGQTACCLPVSLWPRGGFWNDPRGPRQRHWLLCMRRLRSPAFRRSSSQCSD